MDVANVECEKSIYPSQEIEVKNKYIDAYLQNISDGYILDEISDFRWKEERSFQEGVIYINLNKRAYKVRESSGKISTGVRSNKIYERLLPDDKDFQFLKHRLKTNNTELLKAVIKIASEAGHIKSRNRTRLNYNWTKAILKENLDALDVFSGDSAEVDNIIWEAVHPYNTLIQAFDHQFLNLRKYLYGKYGWKDGTFYYDEITDPLSNYYKPDIYTMTSAIHEYITENNKSKTLGIILLRSYITHCIRMQVKILKSARIGLLSFFKKNKVNPSVASVLFYIAPLIAMYVLQANSFSNIAEIILYPYCTILFVKFISIMRARKLKKASLNIIETLLFIGYMTENKVFDCDEVLDRIKILLQKNSDLYLPELIPLIKQIKANSVNNMNGNGVNEITERGFFLFEGCP